MNNFEYRHLDCGEYVSDASGVINCPCGAWAGHLTRAILDGAGAELLYSWKLVRYLGGLVPKPNEILVYKYAGSTKYTTLVPAEEADKYERFSFDS